MMTAVMRSGEDDTSFEKNDVADIPTSDSSFPVAFPRPGIPRHSVAVLCGPDRVVLRYGGATVHESHVLPSTHRLGAGDHIGSANIGSGYIRKCSIATGFISSHG